MKTIKHTCAGVAVFALAFILVPIWFPILAITSILSIFEGLGEEICDRVSRAALEEKQ